jgi:hypothetical protein
MFDALPADCNYLVTVANGSHCAFAVNSTACQLGETFVCFRCDFLDAAVQRAHTMALVVPWLDSVLKTIPGASVRFNLELESGASTGAHSYTGNCAF